MNTYSKTKQELMKEAIDFFTIKSENQIINTNNVIKIGTSKIHYNNKEYEVNYVHCIKPTTARRYIITIINNKTFISNIEINEILNYEEIAIAIYITYFINQ